MRKTLIAAAAAAAAVGVAGCGGNDLESTSASTPDSTAPAETGQDAPDAESEAVDDERVAADRPSLAPPGFENAFPVTVEYEVDGWTYARTFYGGPSATVAKTVADSPPGYASMELAWSGEMISESGELSLDEGRNAPGTVYSPRWAVWWAASENPGLDMTKSCSLFEQGPHLGYVCWTYDFTFLDDQYVDLFTGINDPAENDPLESEVDAVMPIFDEIDGVLVGVTNNEGPSPDCWVKVTKDGTITEFEQPDESACVNYYQGERGSEGALPAPPVPGSTPTNPDTTQLANPVPTEIPAGFKSCGAATGGQVVFVNEVTSCPFAVSVADAWSRASNPSLLSDVPSPVTGRTYDMRCGGSTPTRCEGGNDATVLIYP